MENMIPTFGLISEGPTDQNVIKNILVGFTTKRNVSAEPLQPKEGKPGNWDRVFKYCESEEFKDAFNFYDFIVVQIDTDFMHRDDVPKQYKIDLTGKNTIQIVDAFKQKFIELIGRSFYTNIERQVIFAIAVNEMECWLLPIFSQSDESNNCKDKLKQALKNDIDIQNKRTYLPKTDYAEISKPFLKKKDLLKYAKKQASFQLFMDELSEKVKLN